MDSSDSSDSVSKHLVPFKTGDRHAGNELIQRYWDRVLRAASSRLRDAGIRVVDGEDVAVSVFASLFRRAEENKFSDTDLEDREDLWNLLSRLIRNKSVDAVRRERAKKRGEGAVRGESVFMNPNDDFQPGIGGVEEIAEPPIERAALAEQQALLMESLNSDVVREVVMLRLEGYETSEIASRVGLSDRSVRRKIAMAREAWQKLCGE